MWFSCPVLQREKAYGYWILLSSNFLFGQLPRDNPECQGDDADIPCESSDSPEDVSTSKGGVVGIDVLGND
jgi:hypothetical protein